MDDLNKIEPRMQQLLTEGETLIENGQTSELVAKRSIAIKQLWEDIMEQAKLRKEVNKIYVDV